ncbi:MAG: hypothetical protein IT292_12160 [Deltaproteobacteria bacterium]|nr:hypothetical protein [Deltaproteobacteria bacterium]
MQFRQVGSSYTSLSYNTIHPCTNPAHSGSIVENKLSLVNFGISSKTFTVEVVKNGTLVYTESLSIPAKSRRGLTINQSRVGSTARDVINIFGPSDGTQFLAQMVRYGRLSTSPGTYIFAIPIVSSPGSDGETDLLLTRRDSAYPALEIRNLSY